MRSSTISPVCINQSKNVNAYKPCISTPMGFVICTYKTFMHNFSIILKKPVNQYCNVTKKRDSPKIDRAAYSKSILTFDENSIMTWAVCGLWKKTPPAFTKMGKENIRSQARTFFETRCCRIHRLLCAQIHCKDTVCNGQQKVKKN